MEGNFWLSIIFARILYILYSRYSLKSAKKKEEEQKFYSTHEIIDENLITLFFAYKMQKQDSLKKMS